MNNNDVLKKLRVALKLRDDEIVEILKLVDFNITRGALGDFFRNEDHPNYVEAQDQVLRNFLNALIIHLRGPKEEGKPEKDISNAKKNPFDAVKKTGTSRGDSPIKRKRKD